MYKLIFDKNVEKFLKKQDNTVRLRIRNALLELAENPYRASQVKRLVGRERQFRKRVGEYRIIYEIVDQQLVILVLKVSNRGSAYQD
ncbi:type II toxin-antitoxin system RelE/ParE family toxin [Paenibacillus yanchengensis]|uniref:Type II toxin-antitoxin system RelE/ParE family toxin n=1 Tax=Paenibacillus yanchengensis TaxID=2035833 RepID=A0ABW4YKY2_9BACL